MHYKGLPDDQNLNLLNKLFDKILYSIRVLFVAKRNSAIHFVPISKTSIEISIVRLPMNSTAYLDRQCCSLDTISIGTICYLNIA